MDGALIFSVAGSVGVSSVIVAIVTAAGSRKKIGADATSILTNAAGGIVTVLQLDNSRLRASNDEMSARLLVFETTDLRRGRRDDQLRRAFEVQTDYSRMCAERLRAAGIDVIDPPIVLFDFEENMK